MLHKQLIAGAWPDVNADFVLFLNLELLNTQCMHAIKKFCHLFCMISSCALVAQADKSETPKLACMLTSLNVVQCLHSGFELLHHVETQKLFAGQNTLWRILD